MAPIIVQATISIAGAVLAAAGMSFIGLGIMPPTPEWGSMLSSGRSYIRDYWFVVTFPGLAIMLTVFSINLLGDGLRDALDPRLKT
jgi:peptide/nickel transport system permease protein